MEDHLRAKREILDFLQSSSNWRLSLSGAGEFQCSVNDFSLDLAYEKLLITFRLSSQAGDAISEHMADMLTRRILNYEINNNKFLNLRLGKFGSRETFGAIISPFVIKPPVAMMKQKRKLLRDLLRTVIRNNFGRVKMIKTPLSILQGLPKIFASFTIPVNGKEVVIAAISKDERQAETNSLLSVGLILYTRLKKKRKNLKEIYLIVPEDSGSAIVNRAAWINKRLAKIKIMQVSHDKKLKELKPRRVVDPRRYAWPMCAPFRTSPPLMKIIQLKPTLIRRHPRVHGYDSLRIHGLEFARAYGKNREVISFGIGEDKKSLTDKNWPELKRLVLEITGRRRFDAPDKHHILYRLQEERWLESVLLEDITKIGADLDRRYVYAQVPVYLGEDRRLADILTTNKQGRLIVIEIKVNQDLDLPFQGLDYWNSVHWYNQHNFFRKHGYFQGARLTRDYPHLYLVAPLFKFHKTFETVTQYIDPRVQIFKYGINWDWRKTLKVLRVEKVQH